MILVTGAAGYIGSVCVLSLINKGYDVVMLDNLSTGHIQIAERLIEFQSNYKGKIIDFIQEDIRNKESLDKVFKKYEIDTVIHFAAASLVNESVNNPQKYYNNNVIGTLTLLDSMIENNVKNLVFSSTCATYGEPEYIPIDELHPQKPVNPYGNTKLAIEFAIKDYSKAYNLNYVIFRYFNVIGADNNIVTGEWHDTETHLVPNILKADKEKIFNLYGDDYETNDGTCVRDYIDVQDLADAHRLAFEYLLKGNENTIINLGTGEGQSVKEIFSAVEKTTEREIPVQIMQRREGDPGKLIADNQKAKDVLGWSAKTHLHISILNASRWEDKLKNIHINSKEIKV